MKLIDKRSKKIKKEEAKKMRVVNGFNTGTRTHKSKKDYDRKAIKKELRKYLQGNHSEDDSPLFFLPGRPHVPAIDFLKNFYYNLFIK